MNFIHFYQFSYVSDYMYYDCNTIFSGPIRNYLDCCKSKKEKLFGCGYRHDGDNTEHEKMKINAQKLHEKRIEKAYK